MTGLFPIIYYSPISPIILQITEFLFLFTEYFHLPEYIHTTLTHKFPFAYYSFSIHLMILTVLVTCLIVTTINYQFNTKLIFYILPVILSIISERVEQQDQ